MTAPDRTTWTVAEDPGGDETLWHGDTAALRRYELGSPALYGDLLWQVLTHVLAPDEATIERLAQAMVGEGMFFALDQADRWAIRQQIRAVLAALADTSAHGGDTTEIPATCVHNDGTEHPAPSRIYWSPESQRWVRMYGTCDWRGDARDPRRLGTSRKRVDFAAALADTSAQARHTDGDATGGGEHG